MADPVWKDAWISKPQGLNLIEILANHEAAAKAPQKHSWKLKQTALRKHFIMPGHWHDATAATQVIFSKFLLWKLRVGFERARSCLVRDIAVAGLNCRGPLLSNTTSHVWLICILPCVFFETRLLFFEKLIFVAKLQNVGNHIGDRSCVRQSKLYRRSVCNPLYWYRVAFAVVCSMRCFALTKVARPELWKYVPVNDAHPCSQVRKRKSDEESSRPIGFAVGRE